MVAASLMAEAPPAPDVGAFTALYEREFKYVWHTLRRLGIPSRELPDVTHDVFVTLYRRFHTYDPSRPLKPWLFGIAYRVAADHRRLGRNAREELDDASDQRPGTDAVAADEALVAHEDRALVREALEALDVDRRAVLVAHDIDEQPMVELAHALAVPVKTLYSRLSAAREQFVAALRRARARRGER